MAPGRLLSLAFGPAVAVALAVPAWAQTTRGSSPNPSANGQEASSNSQTDNGDANSQDRGRSQSPWNDPAMQLRRLRDQVSTYQSEGDRGRGGRGGFGGFGRGGGGGIQSVLMDNTALQDAIEMTDQQKQAVETLDDTASQQRRDLYRAMRDNSSRGNTGGRGGPGGFGGPGGPGGRGGFDPAMMQKMQQMRTTQTQQQQSALSKILSKKQQSRLNQIRLQILGPLGVAETDVAKALMMSSDQYAQIQQIMKAMETQRDQMRRAAFSQARGPGGGPGGTQNQAANNDNNRRGRGRFDPNSPEGKAMLERMQKMADDDAALEKKAISAIAKVLTPSQRTKFNHMLGEPYDLAKLVEDRGGRGSRGRSGGPPNGSPRTSDNTENAGRTTPQPGSSANR